MILEQFVTFVNWVRSSIIRKMLFTNFYLAFGFFFWDFLWILWSERIILFFNRPLRSLFTYFMHLNDGELSQTNSSHFVENWATRNLESHSKEFTFLQTSFSLKIASLTHSHDIYKYFQHLWSVELKIRKHFRHAHTLSPITFRNRNTLNLNSHLRLSTNRIFKTLWKPFEAIQINFLFSS